MSERADVELVERAVSPIRIVVADDHTVLRQSLGNLLGAQPDMLVVGQAADGHEALSVVEREKPDVVLLDISMPGLGGLQALRELQRSGTSTRCLILSMHDEPGSLRLVMEAGARGYVTKRAPSEELLRAIRTVASGRSYFNVRMPDTPAESGAPQPLEKLSPREQQVLELVAYGHTSKEIAEQLDIAQTTVDVYRSRVMKKIGATTRAELVRYALDAGILSPG